MAYDKVIDPVCGMDLDPETADAKTEYSGQTYYFCSEVCKEEFESDPDGYIRAAVPEYTTADADIAR